MLPRLVTWLAVAGSLVAARNASAQALPSLPDVEVDPVGIAVTAEDPPQKRSYAIPAVEILAMEIAVNIGARLYGSDWATINPTTMKRNLSIAPETDHDPYTTNNLGHPLGGAALFSAARSSGHGFWVSGLYTFAGSLVWEVLLENEIPSINDQITTPLGGMVIGEALHRFGRALLYEGYGKPNLLRRAGASIIDPVAAANRAWWGDAWSKTVPPNMYAHVGVGLEQPVDDLGGKAGDKHVHIEFVAEHGLTGDASFKPRRPMDHFELRGAFDVNPDDLDGTLYSRGLLIGSGFGSESGGAIRGLGGLFGAYDFTNQERVRHAMLGFGPGGTAELKIGERGYLQGTVAGYLVPWGAAGGITEDERMLRDYHHGPGLAALAEAKFGERRLGEIRVTSRLYRVQGDLTGEGANETVVTTTVGARIHVARRHAIGLEGTHGYRRESITEGMDTGSTLSERSTELRLFYALTTGR